jgi:hypothetical protein
MFVVFASSVEYEHVPSNLNQRRACLLSSFRRDGFGGFRLERGLEDFDFHHLVLVQLLIDILRRLLSETFFAHVNGGFLLFQLVFNVSFHSGCYLAQFLSSPSSASTGFESASRN